MVELLHILMTNHEAFPDPYGSIGFQARNVEHNILYVPSRRLGVDILTLVHKDPLYHSYGVPMLRRSQVREMEEFMSGERKPDDPVVPGIRRLPICLGFDYCRYEGSPYQPVIDAIRGLGRANWSVFYRQARILKAVATLEKTCVDAQIIRR